jgi:nicotinic acid mononucleotide adenylyltransferase
MVTDDVTEAIASISAEQFPPKFAEAVLVLAGAFNPVHREHMHILNYAKKFIEREVGYRVVGYRVVGGAMAPATDQFVTGKSPEFVITGGNRVAMCNLALQEHPWMSPCTRTYQNASDRATELLHSLSKPDAQVLEIYGGDKFTHILPALVSHDQSLRCKQPASQWQPPSAGPA